jgi:RNA polymerase sigma-70 factor (ECF subfamily)
MTSTVAATTPSPFPRRAARFDELIRAHTPVLQAVARRLCREPALAADLVQDTLERAWRGLPSLQDPGRARGWQLRILRNAWLDQLRRRRAEVPIDELGEPSAAPADEPPWWARLTLDDLRRAIARLEEPYRSAAALHDLDGRSYREVAALLELPPATAATRIHRAHGRIRELLRRELEAA